jgi:hypothetical protein
MSLLLSASEQSLLTATWVSAICTLGYFIATIILVFISLKQLNSSLKAVDHSRIAIEKSNRLAEYQIYKDFEQRLSGDEFKDVYTCFRKDILSLKDIPDQRQNSKVFTIEEIIGNYLNPLEDLHFAYEKGLISLSSIQYSWEFMILIPGKSDELRHVIHLEQENAKGDLGVYCGYIALYTQLRELAIKNGNPSYPGWETKKIERPSTA